MTYFSYEAVNADHEKVLGEIEARNRLAVTEVLRSNGLRALKVQRMHVLRRCMRYITHIYLLVFGVKAKVVWLFSHQMGAMIKGGVPLAKALLQTAHMTKSKRFARLLYNAYHRLIRGETLETVFKGYPKVFPKVFFGFLDQAKHTRKLYLAFQQFSEFCEYSIKFKRSVFVSIIPSLLNISIVYITSYFIHKKIFKNIMLMLSGLNQPVPYWTGVFDSVTQWLFTLKFIIGVALGIGGYAAWTFMRKLPVIQKVIAYMQYLLSRTPLASSHLPTKSRFLKLLVIGLEHGLPLQSAFSVAARSVHNILLGQRLRIAEKKLQAGESIETVLRSINLFNAVEFNIIVNSVDASSLFENFRVVLEAVEGSIEIRKTILAESWRIALMMMVSGFSLLTLMAFLFPLMGWQ